MIESLLYDGKNIHIAFPKALNANSFAGLSRLI